MRLGWAAGVAAVATAFWALRDIPVAIGGKPDLERLRKSPQFRDGTFHNAAHTTTMSREGMRETVRELVLGRQRRTPTGAVPMVHRAEPATDGLHVTWYGHSSALIEIDGARVLIDPVWGERVSPSQHVGPKRLHPTPVPLDTLPRVDAIVISHDHYDHLDLPSVRMLTRTQDAPFLVPLGVGAHLRRWHVPENRIVEFDWWDRYTVAGLELIATPAQHFSGRLFKRDGTLWTSWAILGPTHRAFYTGDSGYFDGYAEIGRRFGPFDVSLVQIGAYGPGWPAIHMTPEEGVAAHVDVGADVMIPVHWATFNLAMHAWAEPADRVWRESKARDVRLVVPRPGERVDVADPPAVDDWWQALA